MELPVQLHKRDMQALAVQSDPQDKRNLKAAERAIDKERAALYKGIKKELKVAYA